MKLKNENGNIKVIIAIVVVVIAIVLGIVLSRRTDVEKTVTTISQEAYEYFDFYTLDEKVGVVGKDGNTIINPEYAYIYIPNKAKDVFFCFDDEDNYKIFDKTGKELFKEFTNVYPIIISSSTLEMEKQVLSYEKDDRIGLIDFSGNVIADAVYEDISSLPNKPGCLLVRKDGLYGVLDSEGNIIIDTKYNTITGDEFSSEKDGYLKTGYIISTKSQTGILYGYIDYKGNLLVEPKYEVIERPLTNNTDDIYLIFRENGKRGIIKNKKVILKSRYQYINYNDTSKIFIVTKNGKYGFYDIDGDEILAPEYTSYSVAGNYICVSQESKTMLYDLHGNLVNSNRYKSILETGNPSFFIAQDNSGFYSIISKDSEIADNYTNITYAFKNFFVYTDQNGLSGILDVYTGVEVEAQYDYIIVLENANVLEARKGDSVDIYSNIIEKVLTMSGAVVEKVDEKYTAIYNNTELKYIDNEGKIVENTEIFKNLSLYSYQNGEGKWGYKNISGETKIDAIYDRVTELNIYGFAGIMLDGKWGVIDKDGNIIVEPAYEIETYYAPSFIGKYLLEEAEDIHCIELAK